MSDYDIQTIKIRDLRQFADDYYANWKIGDMVPTTPRRANSQAANPNAESDDPALYVGYRDGACVAYLGLMPGVFRVGKNVERVFFTTTAYADERRGAEPLIRMAYKSLQLPVHGAAIDNTVKANGIFGRLKRFREVAPLTLLRFDVDTLDAILRAVPRSLTPLEPRQVEAFPEEWEDRRAKPVRPEFYRSLATINWMLSGPWYGTEQDPVNLAAGSYHFADRRLRFEYHALAASNVAAGDLACLVFSITRQFDWKMTLLKPVDLVSIEGRLDPIEELRLAVDVALRNGATCIDWPASSLADTGLNIYRALRMTRHVSYFLGPTRNDTGLGRHLLAVRPQLSDSDMGFF